MELEMKIRGLMMDPVTNMPIVVLKDVQGSAVLPIWVGVYEANAIALEIEKVQTPRPMTHDLLKNVFLGFDVRCHSGGREEPAIDSSSGKTAGYPGKLAPHTRWANLGSPRGWQIEKREPVVRAQLLQPRGELRFGSQRSPRTVCFRAGHRLHAQQSAGQPRAINRL